MNKCLYEELDNLVLELQRRLVYGVISETVYLSILEDFKKTLDDAYRLILQSRHE